MRVAFARGKPVRNNWSTIFTYSNLIFSTWNKSFSATIEMKAFEQGTFCICGRNPKVRPIKWKLLSSTFLCAVYYAVQGGSNFWVCGCNPKVWPFKWKLLSSILPWYCLLRASSYEPGWPGWLGFRDLASPLFSLQKFRCVHMRRRAGPVTEISVFATEISVTELEIFRIFPIWTLQPGYRDETFSTAHGL